MKELIMFIIFSFGGFLFGVLTVVNTITYGYGKQSQNLLYECEKTLPRNIKCSIKAEVPK